MPTVVDSSSTPETTTSSSPLPSPSPIASSPTPSPSLLGENPPVSQTPPADTSTSTTPLANSADAESEITPSTPDTPTVQEETPKKLDIPLRESKDLSTWTDVVSGEQKSGMDESYEAPKPVPVMKRYQSDLFCYL